MTMQSKICCILMTIESISKYIAYRRSLNCRNDVQTRFYVGLEHKVLVHYVTVT